MKNQSSLKKSLVCVLMITMGFFLPSLIWNSSLHAKSPGEHPKAFRQELAPMVVAAYNFAESEPLRDLAAVPPDPAAAAGGVEQIEEREKEPRPNGSDVVTNPLVSFDGIDMDSQVPLFGLRIAQADANADVGPDHVVLAVNRAIRFYNKTGTPLTAVTPLSTLFAGLNPPCNGLGDGDPVVLYDSLADRWLISEFCLTPTQGRTHQFVAISQTGDPTGQYFLYDFLMPENRLNTSPHFGVWPDAYYMTDNGFLPPAGTSFLGPGFYAFNRQKMLLGDPTADYIFFSLPPTTFNYLPTDLDGVVPPPIGTPNLFMRFEADEFGTGSDELQVYELRPNFTNPALTTFTARPDIPLQAFDGRNPPGRTDIEQPSPGEGLEAIADRLMQRLAYRKLANGTQSYVLNFTVNVSSVTPTNAATYQAGIRWMELRRDSVTGAVTINQQETYAPGAGNGAAGRNLWLASIAQDGEGNIGLGFNASSTTLNPTAIYTGRLASDPLSTLPQGEVDALATITKGVQTGTGNRWGDYSSLSVDPADECTFWGAFEYLDAPTASFDWNTRIFSFKVNPNCQAQSKSTIQGVITNCQTGAPVSPASLTTPEGYFRQTNAAGNYSMTVAPGTYTVTTNKPGFNSATDLVTATSGAAVTLNRCLEPTAAANSISGTITYGDSAASTPKPVPGVLLTAAGTPPVTITTNSAGAYILNGLGSGPYAVTPSKTGDVNGISSFDASLAAQHSAGLITLTTNQQIAADASNNGTVSSFDASLIAQTAAGIANTGIAGTWKFVPINLSFPALSGNLTGQNITALLVGDASANWTPPVNSPPLAADANPASQSAAAKSERASRREMPGQAPTLTVSLPHASGDHHSSVTIPIMVESLTGKGVVSYDFTMSFDPAVLQLPSHPFDQTGTLSREMNLTFNASTPGRLTISAFSSTPLRGDGLLLKLTFNVVGAPGSATLLKWESPRFFLFNEAQPHRVDGRFTVSGRASKPGRSWSKTEGAPVASGKEKKIAPPYSKSEQTTLVQYGERERPEPRPWA